VLFLGGEGEVSALFRSKRVKLLFPLNCLEVHSDKLYTWCKRGCLQYVIIRPIMTFTAVLAQLTNVLCPGTMDPRFGYIWINFINLASVTVAMYTLVLVYVITSEKLQPFSPIPKFWAIKSIIFLSFWQQIIVVAMQKAGVLDQFENQYFTADNIADGIQNVCICIEMVFCSIAHIYAFTYEPYVKTPYVCPIPTKAATACCGSASSMLSCFLYVLNPIDLWEDFIAFVKLKSAEVIVGGRRRCSPLITRAAGEDANVPDCRRAISEERKVSTFLVITAVASVLVKVDIFVIVMNLLHSVSMNVSPLRESLLSNSI
jgi:hypothetical protein